MQSYSLYPPDAVQGFGCLQQVFCNANGVCIDRHIACGCYETSQHAFQNLKIILQSGPSAFKFNLKRTVIFFSGVFCVCIHSKQGELVPTRNFWIWFYKSDFKNTCWASPKPDIQHKNALVLHLNGRWISKFFGEKFVLKKSALIHPISHQTGPITSGFSLGSS